MRTARTGIGCECNDIGSSSSRRARRTRRMRAGGIARWATVVVAMVTAGPVSVVAASAAPIDAAMPSASAAQPSTVSMAFSGDVLIHRPIVAQALENGRGATYDFVPMFARIAPLVSSVDLAVCHMETPIAPPGEPLSGHPIYGVPREVIAGIASAGYDRCSTASNHSFDRGTAGIDATVDALDAAGIGSTGMARTPAEAEPHVFTTKDIRFTQLDYTFSLNGLSLPPDQPWRVRFLDADKIIADARLARERGAEYVFVNLHWGAEKSWQVTAAQRSLAEALTASGLVDLIVGEHVHVLQPIEQINGRWVVYGTSNLLSNLPGGDASFPASSQDGAIVTLSVTRQSDGSLTTARPVIHPTWVDHNGYVVRPVLEDLADPTTPPGVRAELEASLARTREVLGDYVAGAAVGPIPARCATEPPTTVPVSTFAVSAASAKYVPLDPARIYDSRELGDAGYVCPGAAITVPVAGRVGVPASGATAAVLNVTAIAAGGGGFVTVWPAGLSRPTVSSLNLTTIDQTRPNLVTVPLGEGGAVSIFSQSGAHVAIDVAGYFTGASSSADGRLVAVAPQRVLDTRVSGDVTGGQRVGVDQSIDVQIAGRGGVPSSGASAVVVNLTGTDPLGAGFVTAWPTGSARPVASNVNVLAAGDTSPNLAIVRLGTGGKISLFAHSATHVVADVTAYVTDASAASTGDGLFVPLAPARLFDTRESSAAASPSGKLPAGGTVTVTHAGHAGIPASGVAALALNVTAVEASGAGFVTAYPAGIARPETSTLNVVTDDTRPNATIIQLGANGAISYFSQTGAHVLADVTGYFTAPRSGSRSRLLIL